MLRSRVHNIRTGLSKLNAYSKALTSATGGGLLPPKAPPKVPFELTPTVREFAAVIAIKLSGLPACGDSDGTQATTLSSSLHQPLQSPLMAETNNETSDEAANAPENESPELESLSLPLDDGNLLESVYDSGMSVDLGTSLPSAPTEPSSSTTPQPSSSKQFFATTKQQRKRQHQRDTSTHYYDEKATLVASESTRREELHAIQMKIKQEELAAKQQITAFWKLATEKLSANDIPLGVVSSLATIQPPCTDPRTPIEAINLEHAEIDEMFTDGEICNDANVTLNQETDQPKSPSLSEHAYHHSPFRLHRMNEEESGSSASYTSESDLSIDNEIIDPTFQPNEEN